MDTKSKILFGLLILLITLSVSASFYRYVILHDYIVEAETDCDPALESCFVWICDEEIDGECAGNEEEDTWYYKIIHRNAKNIPTCSDEDDACEQLICTNGEEECEIITCTDEARSEYEIELACTTPEDFVEEEFFSEDMFNDEVAGEEEILVAEEDIIPSEDTSMDDENIKESSEENNEPILQ